MSEDTAEEHEIIATSVREYKGHIRVDMLPESEEYVDHSWRFEEETKRTYECKCGDKFRKKETAVGHLEEVAESGE